MTQSIEAVEAFNDAQNGNSELKKDALTLSADNYGPLWKYVDDSNITDCDFNGVDLWLTDRQGRRIRVDDHGISKAFVDSFSQRVANKVSKSFNKMNPLLEAETSTLRISIVHESAAVSGRSICLRKTGAAVHINMQSIIETNYLPRPVANLLTNCIRSKMNVVIGGEPGAGKTELAKFLTQFIPKEQRVITIEDSPEWNFRKINPGHDCVEMRVSEEFDYSAAIKTCLRQNPKWIALSEARGEEAKWLITSWSTGVNGVTTIHTDDIRKVPGRLISMMKDRNDAERMISDIFEFVNVAILVRRKAMPDGTARRYVDQVGFLSSVNGKNEVVFIVKNGEMVNDQLPEDIQIKFDFADIKKPFDSEILDGLVGDVFEYTPLTPSATAEVETTTGAFGLVDNSVQPQAAPVVPTSNQATQAQARIPVQLEAEATSVAKPATVPSEPERQPVLRRNPGQQRVKSRPAAPALSQPKQPQNRLKMKRGE